MKKNSLLEDVHDEQAYYPGKRSLPKLSYKAAMSSWFILSHQVHQVQACSAHEFREFALACAKGAPEKKRVACEHALKGLDLRENLARFFLLNELLSNGATVHLFSSSDDARRAILMAKSEDARK